MNLVDDIRAATDQAEKNRSDAVDRTFLVVFAQSHIAQRAAGV